MSKEDEPRTENMTYILTRARGNDKKYRACFPKPYIGNVGLPTVGSEPKKSFFLLYASFIFIEQDLEGTI